MKDKLMMGGSAVLTLAMCMAAGMAGELGEGTRALLVLGSLANCGALIMSRLKVL